MKAKLHPCEQQVERAIVARELFEPGESIVVAVSGGLDSMTLLTLLARLAPRHGWTLHVAHFNHQLRGAESDGDAAFVRAQADRLGLACTVGVGDVKAHARRGKLSIEMAARELRRKFLVEVAEAQRSSSIALAHHADDQVELFFLRLLRGSGSEGLRGMQWRSQSEQKTYIHFIRPLLDLRRAHLMVYVADRSVDFREDSSNALLEHMRNRVRHELLPVFDALSPGASREPILRTMELLREEGALLSEVSQEWLQESERMPFDDLHTAMQRRILHEQLIDLAIEPEFELTERLRSMPGKRISVSANLWLARQPDGLVQVLERTSPAARQRARRVQLKRGGGTITVGKKNISYSFEARRPGSVQMPASSDGTEYFDAAQVGPAIRLRTWRAGDRFQPIGLNQPAKLQDLFTNAKVPQSARASQIIAENAEGEIFWVEGLRIGEPCKVTPATRTLLRWKIAPER